MLLTLGLTLVNCLITVVQVSMLHAIFKMYSETVKVPEIRNMRQPQRRVQDGPRETH